jgi:Cof subfamily protein (haloacid dehalogenase superfamily)
MNKMKSFQKAKDLLYISDLDGTLLQPNGTFSTVSKQRLNHLIEEGMKFTIATARNYDSANPILEGLNLKLPAVLFNGVYLADFHNGKILEHTPFIDKVVVDSMLTLAQAQNIEPFIYTFGEEHQVYYRHATNPGSIAYLASLEKDGRVKHTPEFIFQEDENVAGFLLIGTMENLKHIHHCLQEKYFDHLNLYFSEDVSMKGYYWLQAFHQQANKGIMVEKLVDRLNFPLNKTMVFGDYLNDLDMFQVAGYSVAMENALPEVKESADQIIGPNSEGAVLNFLESIWMNA